MIRRLLAASLVAAGTALAAAPPAQAAMPPCHFDYDLFEVGNSIRAYTYHICIDQEPVAAGVSLQRRNPATGGWPVLAQGIGEARFTCFGTGCAPTATRRRTA